MITLIVGKKGSGKTKKLIERANAAVQKSDGNVVVIEKGLKLTYDISHQARLIDVEAYGIQNIDGLYGFISGICAGNYDVTDLYIDSTLKVIGQDQKPLFLSCRGRTACPNWPIRRSPFPFPWVKKRFRKRSRKSSTRSEICRA